MNVRTRAHAYRTQLTWTGAAQGGTSSYAAYSRAHRIAFEGKPSLEGSADPTFRGDAAAYNPEELLVASLSACHMLSYLAVCALGGVEVVAYADAAVGTMEDKGGAGRFTSTVLRPHVTISRGDLEKARELHHAAHDQCFIAASVNFPVDVEPLVEHAEGAR